MRSQAFAGVYGAEVPRGHDASGRLATIPSRILRDHRIDEHHRAFRIQRPALPIRHLEPAPSRAIVLTFSRVRSLVALSLPGVSRLGTRADVLDQPGRS